MVVIYAEPTFAAVSRKFLSISPAALHIQRLMIYIFILYKMLDKERARTAVSPVTWMDLDVVAVLNMNYKNDYFRW